MTRTIDLTDKSKVFRFSDKRIEVSDNLGEFIETINYTSLEVVGGVAMLEVISGGGGGDRTSYAFLDFEHWPVRQTYDTAQFAADGLTADFSRWRRDAQIVASPSLGNRSLQVKYDAGSFGGGAGPNVEAILPPQDEYTLSYHVQFANNFEWVKGGKLPGLAGKGLASGGQDVTGSNGFTARYMWRADGRVVLYLYHMDKPGKWGEDLQLRTSTGIAKYFQRGKWHELKQRIKINTANNKDGQVQVWMDGEEVLLRTGIRFVNNGAKVDRFYFNTFHGGGDPSWAPSITSYACFDNIDIR